MKIRLLIPVVCLLASGACDGVIPAPDHPSIAGSYRLLAVNGSATPCCGLPDTTGAKVTVLGGWLTLADAAPAEWVATPAGYMARSCVHEVPNGAIVDTANVVHMPDGSSYKLPDCGDAPYTMTIYARYDRPDGSSPVVTTTVSGKYVWGEDRITLVGTGTQRGWTGAVSSDGMRSITVAPATVLPKFGIGPEYRFVLSLPD